MFQFSYCMTPVPLTTYISKLRERAPTEGRLCARIICMECEVAAANMEGKETTIVSVVSMLGLISFMAVVLMVSGLGDDVDARLRL